MQPDQHDPDSGLAREGETLRALARSLLASTADAEDVVQDASAAALASPASARRGLGPWLSGTVRNLAAMLRRSDARRRAREAVAARPELDAGSDPAAIAMHAELMQDVATAVRELEEPFRSVVVLRFWRGLRPEQIAQELAVPRNTVRSRLQRGLERLRARLDRKYGARQRWAAPLAMMVSAREVAAVTVAGGGVVLFAGMMMKAKLLLGAAVVLVAAAVIPWSLAGERSAPPLVPQAPAPTPIAASPSPSEPSQRQDVSPTPAPPAAATAESKPAELVAVTPWTKQFLVIDEDDHPIAGAEITIWGARPARPRGNLGPTYSGREGPARLQLRSDDEGRATAVLDVEAGVARAARPGIGQSRERLVFDAKAEVVAKLVLEPEILLHGRVVEGDGGPTVGAKVEIGCSPAAGNFIDRGMPTQPEPVTTDANGEFQLQVLREVTYRLQARSGARESFAQEIDVMDSMPPAAILTFPGSITIDGIVVDADGQPVAGSRVTAWRLLHDDERGGFAAERIKGTADALGRFHLDVRRCAGYQLLAAAEGHATSAVIRCETTAPRPHAEVKLVLQRFAAITGRVLRPDGTPMPGIKVVANPESGDASARDDVPNQEDLFPRVQTATCGDDGSFRLQVHPGTKWTLSARLVPDNWRMAVHREGVAPGSDAVLLTITDADLAGCVVRGTVRRRDGQPISNCRVVVVDCGADGRETTSSEVHATFDGGDFACPPLPRGQTFGLRVTMLDGDGPQARELLAPATVAPFSTDRDTLHFDLWLDAWGLLPVSVLEADGSPARRIGVYLRHNRSTGADHVVAITDADGKLVVPRCVPGPHRLFVSRGATTLQEQEVAITSGINPELVIHLPPPPSTTGKR